MIYLRYVLARPVLPKEPRRSADGTVSRSKRQDTSAASYLEACKEAGHDPDPDTLEHFRDRDKHAWFHTVTFPIDETDMVQIGRELGDISRKMRGTKGDVPNRNLWACTRPRCDWADLCHGNPKGDIENWWGITTSDYDGLASYVIRYKNRFDKVLDRSKPGNVVTASEIRNFLTCPRKWYFENVKNAARGEKNYARYSSRWKGNLVHKYAELMAKADFGRPFGIKHTDIGPCWDEYVESLTDQISDEDEKAQLLVDADICQQVGTKMYLMAREPLTPGSHALTAEHAEQRFAALLPGTKTWITCQPDLVCSDDKGNTIIVDYKTLGAQNLVKEANNYTHLPSMYLYGLAVTKGYEARRVENV